MVKKLAIIWEIFKGDHNAVAVAAAARKLTQNQISALSGTLNYLDSTNAVAVQLGMCVPNTLHKK